MFSSALYGQYSTELYSLLSYDRVGSNTVELFSYIVIVCNSIVLS